MSGAIALPSSPCFLESRGGARDITTQRGGFCILTASYALQGEVKLAVEHLEKAIKLDSIYRAEARSNPDFDGLVENEQFWQLIDVEG